MSTTNHDPNASTATVGGSGAGDHGEEHGHAGHGDGEGLGPLDAAAWGAGALGIAAGLVVFVVLALSTGWLG